MPIILFPSRCDCSKINSVRNDDYNVRYDDYNVRYDDYNVRNDDYNVRYDDIKVRNDEPYFGPWTLGSLYNYAMECYQVNYLKSIGKFNDVTVSQSWDCKTLIGLPCFINFNLRLIIKLNYSTK